MMTMSPMLEQSSSKNEHTKDNGNDSKVGGEFFEDNKMVSIENLEKVSILLIRGQEDVTLELPLSKIQSNG